MKFFKVRIRSEILRISIKEWYFQPSPSLHSHITRKTLLTHPHRILALPTFSKINKTHSKKNFPHQDSNLGPYENKKIYHYATGTSSVVALFWVWDIQTDRQKTQNQSTLSTSTERNALKLWIYKFLLHIFINSTLKIL
jgi:outer membrane receptor for Fe3+-dicitrate